MKRLEPFIAIVLLIIAVGFNLWVFRTETSALIDPNDNTFQFALVDRTNQIFSFAQQKCSGIFTPFCVTGFLIDHWVPNWAEGYNLPYYYSHVPQILIVLSYRIFALLQTQLSLFTYYHWVIYLLLCLFPVAVFISVRAIRLPWLAAGLGALVAAHISTDGLYGLDPTSFLWRGYGLSSQLFAMIWLPLSIAYAYRYFSRDSNGKQSEFSVNAIILPVLFLTATTAGHLGLGIIAFMSIAILALSPYIQSILEQSWSKQTSQQLMYTLRQLGILFGVVGLILGYWIIPIIKDGSYHNISVWDGIWKFDSFGYREVLKNLFNGDLFDFGRLPILTILIGIGIFVSAQSAYFPFAVLFGAWLLLYFGRTTWGGLFSLIPGMNDYHLSRFIVGVHIAGIFIIPVAFDWLIIQLTRLTKIKQQWLHIAISFLLIALITLAVYPQTLRYSAHNDFLIARANTAMTQDNPDITRLMTSITTRLAAKPGRVFAGRGGSWGKSFRLAETPMYIHLSTYGIPVILWLPETWSPNSDTEQYFSESNPDHYNLYNVHLVVTPATLPKDQVQPFWRLVEAGETWKLYEVQTDGYISPGYRAAIVSSDKQDYRSVVRLWMHAGYPAQKLYPELTFDKAYPKNSGLPNFRLLDEVTFKVPDGSMHNVFAEVPHYVAPQASQSASLTIVSQSAESDMVFRAVTEVTGTCTQCIVVLKQSFHPSWQVTVDGKKAQAFTVFPFFTAVSLETPGRHEVVFSYQSSATKQTLFIIGLITLGVLMAIAVKTRDRNKV